MPDPKGKEKIRVKQSVLEAFLHHDTKHGNKIKRRLFLLTRGAAVVHDVAVGLCLADVPLKEG